MDGLALALTVGPPVVTFGGYIVVTVEIRNVSGKDQFMNFGYPSPAFNVMMVERGEPPALSGRRVASSFGISDSSRLVAGSSIYVQFSSFAPYWFREPGRYEMHVSTMLTVEHQGIDLESNTVAVTVLPPLPGSRWTPLPTASPTPPVPLNDAAIQSCGVCAGLRRRTPAGPPVDGLALSLTSPTPTVHLGSAIWAIVEVRYVYGPQQSVFFASGSYSNSFLIVDWRARRIVPRVPSVPVKVITHVTAPVSARITPETSLYGAFRLDLLYRFSEPGAYTVQVAEGRPIFNGQGPISLQSNVITIRVLANR